MPDVDLHEIWTVWEIRDSFAVLDWLRAYVPDPDERQLRDPFQTHVITPWELRGDPGVYGELVRAYSYRMN